MEKTSLRVYFPAAKQGWSVAYSVVQGLDGLWHFQTELYRYGVLRSAATYRKWLTYLGAIRHMLSFIRPVEAAQ